MLATGRNDRRGANGRGKNGRNGDRTGADARFEVLGRVGEGTLWIAYRVKHRESGETFALKALKNVFNRHARLPGAILESCAAWQGLDHPHLAPSIEFGSEDDTLFVTSEWLPGGSLESRLNRALTRDEIFAVLRAGASALSFAHSQGLTHGDIRPRQWLFDAQGRLKLTDCGVAQAFSASGLALADVQPDAAWYLAPERTQGVSLAPPADLYALGVMLYRMLAGRVPFDGPSALAIALRHRSDTPLPPSQFNPRCPADLERLAMRLLEKDPSKRLDAPNLERAVEGVRNSTNRRPVPSAEAAPSSPVVPAAPTVIPTAPAAIPVASPAVPAASAAISAVSAAVPVASAPLSAAPAVVPIASAAIPAAAAPVSSASAPLAVASDPTLVASAPTLAAPAADSVASTTVSEPEPPLAVNLPRRRALSPLVDEALAQQKEEEVQLDRKTVGRRHKRREFWGAFGALFWLVFITAAFGGMFYGAYYYWSKESPIPVRVPNYVGLEQEQARQKLSKAGLTLRVGRETYDAKKPAGTVVSGEPEPGRLVRSRREVTVTISQGEAPLTMVNFNELPLAQARTIIAQHAMRLAPIVQQYHDRVPLGFICGQYPEPGESFRRSDPITLIVSRGPQPTEIDATTGALPPLDSPPPVDAAPGAVSGAVSGQNPTFETPSTTLPGQNNTTQAAITRTAVIRVQIPADGGSQQLKIVVNDADGERTAYSKLHRAGDEVEETVQVRRPQGATARVRIYVGSALIKEEQL